MINSRKVAKVQRTQVDREALSMGKRQIRSLFFGRNV
jgi:hypothetical protein